MKTRRSLLDMRLTPAYVSAYAKICSGPIDAIAEVIAPQVFNDFSGIKAIGVMESTISNHRVTFIAESDIEPEQIKEMFGDVFESVVPSRAPMPSV